MFGLHRRNRSLIPVSDLERTEKQYLIGTEEKALDGLDTDEEEVVVVEEGQDETVNDQEKRRHDRQACMIYLLFIFEAVIAGPTSSSLLNSPLPSDTACSTRDAVFIRNVLESAYSLGAAAGILWGCMADRWGRRKTAFLGLSASYFCFLATTIATSPILVAWLRCMAGVAASAVTVAGLTMLADMTHASKRRVSMITRLPLIVAGAGLTSFLTPILSWSLGHFYRASTNKYATGLTQILISSVLFVILVAEAWLLQETYSGTSSSGHNQLCESGSEQQGLMFDDSIHSADIPRRSSIGGVQTSLSIWHAMRAPAISVLLASYAILSFHSAIFDLLLPRFSPHTLNTSDGQGLCLWTFVIGLVTSLIAGGYVAMSVPRILRKYDTLTCYQYMSMWFLIVYLAIPFLTSTADAANASVSVMVCVNGLSALIKAMLANSAQVLVLLLVLYAAPDVASTGTVTGSIYANRFFDALARCVCGIGLFALEDRSLPVLYGALQGTLIASAVIGWGLTYKLRNRPCVGNDIPEECLVWEGVFDTASDDEYL